MKNSFLAIKNNSQRVIKAAKEFEEAATQAQKATDYAISISDTDRTKKEIAFIEAERLQIISDKLWQNMPKPL